MTLRQYLSAHALSQSEFSALVGYHRVTVHHWINGIVPEAGAMRRIFEVTNGAVTPNDFHALPVLPMPPNYTNAS